jgi:hypothetical protein
LQNIHVLSCSNFLSLFSPLETTATTKTQAIDKLEALLNGGMKSGQTNMFGPREYVQIYT